MSEIFELPDNFIGKEDRHRLEAYAAHEIAHGRATRWHWAKDDRDNDQFEIFRGGPDEALAVRISHDRKQHAFRAEDAGGRLLASGTLDHIMAEVDEHFARLHGENPA